MTILRKYFRLFAAFAKASFVADLEYRANFATRILTDIIWYVAQIVTFEALFRVTDKIGDWNLEQMRVFLGILFVVDAIYMILFSDNLDRMAEKVRKGDMDLLLTKPVNSQFMISFQRVNTAITGNLLIALGWLVFSLLNLPEMNWVRLPWLLVLVPVGLASLYSIRFMFTSVSLIFTKADNLQYLWFQLYRLGMRPDSIYFPWLKIMVLSVLPVAAIASVPARAILEAPNPLLFGWVIFWSIAMVYFSHRFWNYCLRFYSSASS